MKEDSFYWLEEYFSYFAGIKERSPATLREYRYDLVLFFRFLKLHRGEVRQDIDLEKISLAGIDEAYLESVKLSEIYHFISWLAQERGNGPAARARRVSSLRSFFTYLHNKVKVISDNPTAELESPKKGKRQPRYLSVEESRQLLAAAANSKGKYNERDYCILTLFLNCGLRLSELVGIDLDDIKEETIRITGKGNKERTIYLNSVAIEALQALLEVHQPARKPDEKALFVSRNRRRISQRAVQNIVKKYILSAGLDPGRYSTHKLRHTAATLMYQYGQVDIRSLQQILGHESIATTEIYTHINQDMLHQAVESNPLNQLRKDDLSDTE